MSLGTVISYYPDTQLGWKFISQPEGLLYYQLKTCCSAWLALWWTTEDYHHWYWSAAAEPNSIVGNHFLFSKKTPVSLCQQPRRLSDAEGGEFHRKGNSIRVTVMFCFPAAGCFFYHFTRESIYRQRGFLYKYNRNWGEGHFRPGTIWNRRIPFDWFCGVLFWG